MTWRSIFEVENFTEPNEFAKLSKGAKSAVKAVARFREVLRQSHLGEPELKPNRSGNNHSVVVIFAVVSPFMPDPFTIPKVGTQMLCNGRWDPIPYAGPVIKLKTVDEIRKAVKEVSRSLEEPPPDEKRRAWAIIQEVIGPELDHANIRLMQEFQSQMDNPALRERALQMFEDDMRAKVLSALAPLQNCPTELLHRFVDELVVKSVLES